MVAYLPAQLLYIAAQFVTTDLVKTSITGINIKRNEDTITIMSTDGHRVFKVSFPVNENYHMSDKELLIDPKPFKKRNAKARYAVIRDDIVKFYDEDMENIFMNEVKHISGNFPEMNGYIWPDNYNNNPEAPIGFNAKYLADFLTEVNRFRISGTVKMQFGDPHKPMQFNATIQPFADIFEAYYLLMPVQIRDYQ